MQIATPLLVAKNIDKAFQACFQTSGSALRIDSERKDGLAFDAAHKGIVGHGVGPTREGAHQNNAVYLVVQVQNGADNLTVDNPRQGVGKFKAFFQRFFVIVAIGEKNARFPFLSACQQAANPQSHHESRRGAPPKEFVRGVRLRAF